MKKILLIGALFASGASFAQCDITNAESAWDNVREDVATQMDVVGPGMDSTTCQLTVNSTASNADRARVQDRSPNCESSFRAHFLLDVDALGVLAANERTKAFNAQCITAQNGGAVDCNGIGAIQLRLQGDGSGNNILRSFVADENEPDLRTRFDVPLTSGENSVELQWIRASSAAASDGVLRVWFPGNTVEANPSFEVTNVDNFGYCIDQVNLGLIKATNAWTANKAGVNIGFDEYESRRVSAISLN